VNEIVSLAIQATLIIYVFIAVMIGLIFLIISSVCWMIGRLKSSELG
jgi:hypothetical protein